MHTFSQTDSITSKKMSVKNTVKAKHRMNNLKFNLTSLALKNYSLQYERILIRKFSFAVAARTMSASGIPFKSTAVKLVGEEDTEFQNLMESIQLSNFAITPEFRFYVGRKGYGRGFYIAPFYRFANYKVNQLRFTYKNDLGDDLKVDLSVKLNCNTGGLLFGAEWPLGKRLCIDWWILGPHFGTGKGEFLGISSTTLTIYGQDGLKEALEDFEIPLTNKTVNVNANEASRLLDGPWGGVRAGLSMGFRF